MLGLSHTPATAAAQVETSTTEHKLLLCYQERFIRLQAFLKKCDDDKQEDFLQSKLKLPDFWRHRSCLITLFLFNFFLIFLMCAMVDKYWGNAVSDQWPFCLTCERIILITHCLAPNIQGWGARAGKGRARGSSTGALCTGFTLVPLKERTHLVFALLG